MASGSAPTRGSHISVRSAEIRTARSPIVSLSSPLPSPCSSGPSSSTGASAGGRIYRLSAIALMAAGSSRGQSNCRQVLSNVARQGCSVGGFRRNSRVGWSVALEEVDAVKTTLRSPATRCPAYRRHVIFTFITPEMSSGRRSLRHGCRSRFECQARRFRYPIDSGPHIVYLRADLGRER
jgi:hypothetical protein